MSGLLGQVLVSLAAGVGCAALLALGNGLRKMAGSVRDSAAATTQLVTQVAKLQEDYQGTREQVAVLWDREHWPLQSPWYLQQPQQNGRQQ